METNNSDDTDSSIADCIKSADWTDHPLGPSDKWPDNLQATISIMSNSTLPMVLFWGSNHFCFFNKAYRPFLNTSSNYLNDLGKKGEHLWSESWEAMKDKLDQVFNNNKTVWSEKVNNNIVNKYEYSPVKDPVGGVGGVLVICQVDMEILSKKPGLEYPFQKENHILESITDGFFEIQEDWTVIQWNREAEIQLKMTREEIVGKNLWEVFPADKAQKSYVEYKKALETKRPSSFEEYFEPLGKWFSVNVHPSTEGITVYFQNITEQRRLQLINERTEQISGVAGWEYDVSTEKVFMTPKAFEIYELPKRKFLSPHINQKLYDEESLDKINKALERAIKHKESYSIELNLTRKEGEKRIIQVNGFPLAKEGKVTKVYGTLEDITQEKEAQEELEKAYTKLKTAQQIAKLGYWTHNIIEDKSDWSENVYNIWERDPNNFFPNFENLLKTIHPEDREIFMGDAAEPFPDKNFYDSEHRIITPDGKVKWIMERITLHRDEEGNPKMLEGIAQDITQQKKQEEKIKEALKEKETLLAEIHHRVKNNLAVVSGMMQLQAFDEENEELRAKLLDSVIRIGSMATIHEQLYQSNSFSKLEFSQNIKTLVEKILNTMPVQADISLDLNLSSIQLNVNQAIPCSLVVNEVVTNIIKHAFKERKKGKIMIDLAEVDEQLKLVIKDDGVGFPENLDISETNTLGYRLINTLAKQLDATFSYRPSPEKEKGTIFYLQFEKSEIKGIGSAYI
ncbi:PAS domain S-box protein [Aliifodinibius salicampi]|uniref:PAS domain S-box protein n=1 Tax=Fodinibius salicampi TaxID=1920655 RepID=A0ABT3Q2F8_9BACT|nr:PAS domain S-box protein [Fodinibius salicampi]MCW9714278.1 PAS domain S-box protein [Fodinibius salicampi]